MLMQTSGHHNRQPQDAEHKHGHSCKAGLTGSLTSLLQSCQKSPASAQALDQSSQEARMEPHISWSRHRASCCALQGGHHCLSAGCQESCRHRLRHGGRRDQDDAVPGPSVACHLPRGLQVSAACGSLLERQAP